MITQHELLTKVCVALKAHNSHDYAISYAPLRNLSEKVGTDIFRFVKPQGFRREVITRGVPSSVHEIVIAHVGILDGISDQQIIDNQNELDAIINLFFGGNNPLQSDGFRVSMAESGPVFAQPVSGEGLEADVRLLIAAVAITFKR